MRLLVNRMKLKKKHKLEKSRCSIVISTCVDEYYNGQGSIFTGRTYVAECQGEYNIDITYHLACWHNHWIFFDIILLYTFWDSEKKTRFWSSEKRGTGKKHSHHHHALSCLSTPRWQSHAPRGCLALLSGAGYKGTGPPRCVWDKSFASRPDSRSPSAPSPARGKKR